MHVCRYLSALHFCIHVANHRGICASLPIRGRCADTEIGGAQKLDTSIDLRSYSLTVQGHSLPAIPTLSLLKFRMTGIEYWTTRSRGTIDRTYPASKRLFSQRHSVVPCSTYLLSWHSGAALAHQVLMPAGSCATQMTNGHDLANAPSLAEWDHGEAFSKKCLHVCRGHSPLRIAATPLQPNSGALRCGTPMAHAHRSAIIIWSA